jgi:hypothetical protein
MTVVTAQGAPPEVHARSGRNRVDPIGAAALLACVIGLAVAAALLLRPSGAPDQARTSQTASIPTHDDWPSSATQSTVLVNRRVASEAVYDQTLTARPGLLSPGKDRWYLETGRAGTTMGAKPRYDIPKDRWYTNSGGAPE